MSVAQRSLFRRLRPRSRTGWIGIDIGSHSVKLAQLEIVDGQKQIAEAAVIPIPEAGLLTADSLQTGWLANALRDELSRHRGFRGRTVACGLSMSVTEFRSMSIPPGSRKERREMIAQELAGGGNARDATVEFDFWDGDANPAATDIDAHVNVLAVSDRLATQVAEAIQTAGLNCRVLDGGPFTLARSLDLMSGHTAVGQPAAVLDWGHRTAHFAVILNGQPVFSRVLKDGEVGPLVESVGRGLGLPPEDCHAVLSTYGVPNPHLDHSERTEVQELVGDMAAESFNRLIAELDKTLSFLGSHRPELAPAELWLLGGGAAIRNAEAKLSFDIRLPVTGWQLPLRTAARTNLEGRPVELLAHAAALSELGWES